MDETLAAFHADNVAPRLVAAWPNVPARVRRAMVKLMTRVASAKESA